MDWDALAAVESPVDEAAVEAELTEYVTGDEVAGPRREPFRIQSVGAADWCMRRVAEAQRRVQDYKDQVTLWTAALRRVEAAGEWFEARLKEWGVAQRTKDTKTFPLAHGTVRTSSKRAAIIVTDEEAAIAWAEQHCPEAVKTEKSFLVSRVSPAAGIMDCVVAWEAINKEDGELQRIPVDSPRPLNAEVLEGVRDRMPGHHVEAEVEAMVVDAAGVPVPGLGVRPGETTATVTPLL